MDDMVISINCVIAGQISSDDIIDDFASRKAKRSGYRCICAV